MWESSQLGESNLGGQRSEVGGQRQSLLSVLSLKLPGNLNTQPWVESLYCTAFVVVLICLSNQLCGDEDTVQDCPCPLSEAGHH